MGGSCGQLVAEAALAAPEEAPVCAQFLAGVAELHEMFLELAFLVEAQGEMVERIACSVTQAQEYTGNPNSSQVYCPWSSHGRSCLQQPPGFSFCRLQPKATESFFRLGKIKSLQKR